MEDGFYSLQMILARAGYFEYGGLFGLCDSDGAVVFPSLANEDNQ